MRRTGADARKVPDSSQRNSSATAAAWHRCFTGSTRTERYCGQRFPPECSTVEMAPRSAERLALSLTNPIRCCRL